MMKVEGYWSTNPDWSYFKDGELHMKDDAPEEAKESFKKYLEDLKLYQEYAEKGIYL